MSKKKTSDPRLIQLKDERLKMVLAMQRAYDRMRRAFRAMERNRLAVRCIDRRIEKRETELEEAKEATKRKEGPGKSLEG